MPAHRKGARGPRRTASKGAGSALRPGAPLRSLSADANIAPPEHQFESDDAMEPQATPAHADSAPQAIRAEADRFYRAVGQDVDRRMAKHDGEFRTSSRSREWAFESGEGIALYASRFAMLGRNSVE
jgi:hypothetical protein